MEKVKADQNYDDQAVRLDWGDGTDEGNGAVSDPALPPDITKILCKIAGTEGSYQVFWSPQKGVTTYQLAVFRYEELVGETVAVTGTSGTITRTVSDDAQYYIGVAPSDNPAAYKKIPVFSTAPVQLNQVRVLKDAAIEVDYAFPGMITDLVQVSLTNTEQSIQKTVELVPYACQIRFKEHGLPALEDYTLTLGAENRVEKTKVHYEPADSCAVHLPRPEFTRLEATADTAAERSFSLSAPGGFWKGGKLAVFLYAGSTLLWSKAKVDALADGSYTISIPQGAFSVGTEGGFFVRFQVEKDQVLSLPSMPVRLLLSVPEPVKCHYTAADTVCFHFRRNCGFPHGMAAAAKEKTYALSPDLKGGEELVSLPLDTGSPVAFSYTSGISQGKACPAQNRLHPAFYLFGDASPCICKSQTPNLDQSGAITVALDSGLGIKTELSKTYFKLLSKDSGYVLEIAKEAWDFSDKAVRQAIKEDFQGFLIEMEEKAFTAGQILAVRGLAEDYLPQSMEEFLYYHGHLDNNFVELFPGLTIKADQQTYQYVGDTGAALYVNGYTGTGTKYAPVSRKKGKLCLDPFVTLLSEGDYVEDLEQPTMESGLCAFGGGSVTDLNACGIAREYAGILYPDHFPSAEKEGAPQVCKNPAVLSASSYKALAANLSAFRKTGVPESGASAVYLRGRTQLTPCMPVTVNGFLHQMPLGSTLCDLAPLTGLLEPRQEPAVYRCGLPVYTFHMTGSWSGDFYLYPGDVISWK
ncbi:hypothetical protein NIA71_04645 [Ihubacter massiliensis]|uniref:Uncharacterized protein n=1 Tax=Hominibacterium faecale TaxID=2839743 RepID=A0A9J6QM22_9FIRM|nr:MULTISPECIES: hypothetical protein [Eubacteriales Family XIII. Incertae Sedis]MCI7303194.1 hypothetical protein [Clostridia bacterium]MDE8732525.1 hypothetical protein [Eubacteriales bacterium DFI.9.88]MDY3012732.1 hypothetical protein [Clostridiales Family XIII bacterium]MCO7121239.1 hypothetical protein [Ihubacter massiliensis]MCU7378225.1 hypothetical protein [Hominibacterium faecale]